MIFTPFGEIEEVTMQREAATGSIKGGDFFFFFFLFFIMLEPSN